MKTLKESILADLEDTLKSGDDFNKIYKKAEKDWTKLLNKTTYKSLGQYCRVSIKSKELARILAGGHPAYKHFACDYEKNYGQPYPNDVDDVTIIYNIDDAFDIEHLRHLQIQVGTKSLTGRPFVVAAAHYIYSEYNQTIPDAININDAIGFKQAIEILSKAFRLKYKTLGDVANAFMDNVKFTCKY